MLNYAHHTFPKDLISSDGHTCIYLQSDNTCGIYADRPLQCRIDDTYHQSPLIQILTLPEWHSHVIDTSCRFSISTHGGEIPPQTGPNMLNRVRDIYHTWLNWNYGQK